MGLPTISTRHFDFYVHVHFPVSPENFTVPLAMCCVRVRMGIAFAQFWGSNSTDIRPNNAQQLGKRLVRGKYDIARYKKGQRLQDYNNAEPVPVKYILYRILDNYGADYTCTYRVRVHGVPIDKAA
mmetsp:Transcript_7114/g.13590  ORF Transcript_7114/g.13590 Transcript_7114/m.13590 type:complete len:126 (+) Transcript_7114:1330-1707(+)